MKILKDRSGYTIIYSLIFMTIILIIGAAIVTGAHVALNVQNENASEKQAYLSAKSIARIFTREISRTVTSVEYDFDGASVEVDFDEENREINSVVPFGETVVPSLPLSSLDKLVAKMITYRSTHLGENISFNLNIQQVGQAIPFDTIIQCTFSDEPGFEYDFVAEITGRNQAEEYTIYAEYVLNTEPNINSIDSGELYTYSFYEYRSNASPGVD